jgi:hypothetical protein
MRVYHASEPATPEEIISHGIATALYVMEPDVCDMVDMPDIKDIYTVGSSLFVHLMNGDLFNVVVQRMTPELHGDYAD